MAGFCGERGLAWGALPVPSGVMIAYVTVGADDLARAKEFYSAILPALGYTLSEGPEGLSFALPVPAGKPATQPDFYVKPTFDGAPASAGNGTMVAFDAFNQIQVRALHAAALAAGGTNEGAPGFRPNYGAAFYVGYLHDPQGNKIALFSSHPDDPTRDDVQRGPLFHLAQKTPPGGPAPDKRHSSEMIQAQA